MVFSALFDAAISLTGMCVAYLLRTVWGYHGVGGAGRQATGSGTRMLRRSRRRSRSTRPSGTSTWGVMMFACGVGAGVKGKGESHTGAWRGGIRGGRGRWRAREARCHGTQERKSRTEYLCVGVACRDARIVCAPMGSFFCLAYVYECLLHF